MMELLSAVLFFSFLLKKASKLLDEDIAIICA